MTNRLSVSGSYLCAAVLLLCSFRGNARAQSVPTDDTINLNRLTDLLDPNILHDDGNSAILTANKTLWMDPATYGKTVPTFWGLSLMDTVTRDCEEMNALRPDAVGPFLRHPAPIYEPTNTLSNINDFENLAKHPENVRIAISYDKLPPNVGPVWKTFPDHAYWHSLAPTGVVRNLKGHEAAVAYRGHGGEPYHYSVMSYDERGRVEALIRYTENLGFDAVYYRYNSMNAVIQLTVVDPLRRYTTWYGYDHNARVDSVWTKLQDPGSGLWDPGTGTWAYPDTPIERDAEAEISYAYTPTGQVDTMFYPRINTQTAYHYSPRKWLDSLIATKGATDIFKQYLTFDPTGQIRQQRSQQGSSSELVQDYSYDALGQLTNWTRNPGTGSQATEEYDYDSVGNRTLLTNRNNVGVVSSWRTYDIGRRVNTSTGPNQMLKSLNRNALAVFNYTTSEYDPDGSMTQRKLYSGGDVLLQEDRFEYSSWRGLNWKYHRSTPRPFGNPLEWEWRYRYNAQGEREQKREVLNPNGDDVASQGYKWSYYLLGGSREQLSLWEGLQTSDTTFCDLPGGGGSYVHLYPSEYLVYGVEYPGVKEDVPRLRLFPDNTQEYRITDHLASVRATLDGTGGITQTYDYKPFGSLFQGGPEARQSFNSREKDQEAGLFNNGVRKLEDDDGRFTSIDPLWEKFPAWSPYQYGYNNPLRMTDPDGRQAIPLVLPVGGGPGAAAGAGVAGGAGVIGGFLVWGVYREFNPTPEMVAATQTAHAEGQIIANMERNSAIATPLPLIGIGIVMASGDKSAEELDKHVGDLSEGRKRAGEIKDRLDKTKGHKDRQKLIDELKDEIREIAGHIKEIKQKWFDGKTGKFKRPDGYNGPEPNVDPPKIRVPEK